MNCTRARTEIALWAGGDLGDQETGRLERHVALCPQCREYRSRMAGSLRALQNPPPPLDANLHDSVWPQVASRLSVQSQHEAQRAERLNRWLPAAAVAAVCLAVIALTSEPEPRQQDIYGQSLPADRFTWGSPASPDDTFVRWQESTAGFGPAARPAARYELLPGVREWGQNSYSTDWRIPPLTAEELPAPEVRLRQR